MIKVIIVEDKALAAKNPKGERCSIEIVEGVEVTFWYKGESSTTKEGVEGEVTIRGILEEVTTWSSQDSKLLKEYNKLVAKKA